MVGMEITNSFDNYKISIHTVNDKDAPGYKIHKIIKCYREGKLIAHLNFFEVPGHKQNSFGDPTAPAPYILYFDMNQFDDIHNLIRHDKHPSITWNPDTGEGSIIAGDPHPIGQ